jgi:hypothetical protein
MQVWFNIWKSNNGNHEWHQEAKEKKTHVVISDIVKSIWWNPTAIHDKNNLSKLEIEDIFPNFMKTMYKNSVANVITNDDNYINLLKTENKVRISLIIPIKHCQENSIIQTERKKYQLNIKKTTFVCWWHDCICGKCQWNSNNNKTMQIQHGYGTKLIYNSQLLSYIPTMNKWNLKLKIHQHLC